MRADLERALRLSPGIRRRLREQHEALQRAVEGGREEEIVAAARALVELEREADENVQSKRAKLRRHLVRFRVSDEDYAELAETALEHRLDPNEVARRYFESGLRLSRHFWGHVRRGGGADTLFAKGPRGFNPLPGIILPDFRRREP